MGGIAGTLHGSRFTTDDVDAVVRGTKRNLDRLEALLAGMGARDSRRRSLEVVMADLRAGGSARLRTRLGAFDVMTEVPSEGDFSYPALARRGTRVDIGGREVMVAALEDLIAMKEQAHRVKDLARAVREARGAGACNGLPPRATRKRRFSLLDELSEIQQRPPAR